MDERRRTIREAGGGRTTLHRRRAALVRTVGVVVLVAVCVAFVAYYRQVTESIEGIRPTMDEFHRLYHAGDYSAIYDASYPTLQQGLTKDEALRRLSQIYAKLGNVVTLEHQCTVRATHRNIRRSEYHVLFENAEAWETYDWQYSGDVPQLLAYAVETGFETGQPDWEIALAPGNVRPNARTCMNERLPYDFWWDPIR